MYYVHYMATHAYAGPTHVNKLCPRVSQTKSQNCWSLSPTPIQHSVRSTNRGLTVVEWHLLWSNSICVGQESWVFITFTKYNIIKNSNLYNNAMCTAGMTIICISKHEQNWPLTSIFLSESTGCPVAKLESTGHWLDIHWICPKSTGFYWIPLVYWTSTSILQDIWGSVKYSPNLCSVQQKYMYCGFWTTQGSLDLFWIPHKTRKFSVFSQANPDPALHNIWQNLRWSEEGGKFLSHRLGISGTLRFPDIHRFLQTHFLLGSISRAGINSAIANCGCAQGHSPEIDKA
jgi:hypothetical protein